MTLLFSRSFRLFSSIFLLSVLIVAIEVQRGVRIRPCEVVWDSTIRVALEALRHHAKDPSLLHAMRFCYNEHQPAVALTLVGMNSGEEGYEPIQEINQDRGFLLLDFPLGEDLGNVPKMLQMGVIDGHGDEGHWVAEYMSYRLQTLQYTYWNHLNEASPERATQSLHSDIEYLIRDRNIDPSSFSMSMALQLGYEDLFFFHHGGASTQTILVAAIVQVCDDDPMSRTLEHVEVVYNYTSTTSVGDEMEPSRTMVYHHSISNAIERQKVQYAARRRELSDDIEDGWVSVDADGTTTTAESPNCSITPPLVGLFLVSATNGVWQYLETEAIVYQLAQALYQHDKYLVTTAQDVIHQAAAQWQLAKHGSFRDDSTLIVAPVVV